MRTGNKFAFTLVVAVRPRPSAEVVWQITSPSFLNVFLGLYTYVRSCGEARSQHKKHILMPGVAGSKMHSVTQGRYCEETKGLSDLWQWQRDSGLCLRAH